MVAGDHDDRRPPPSAGRTRPRRQRPWDAPPSANPRNPIRSMSLTRSSPSSLRDAGGPLGHGEHPQTLAPQVARPRRRAGARTTAVDGDHALRSPRQVRQRGSTISGTPYAALTAPAGLPRLRRRGTHSTSSKASSPRRVQPPRSSLALTPAASAPPSSTARSVAWGRSVQPLVSGNWGWPAVPPPAPTRTAGVQRTHGQDVGAAVGYVLQGDINRPAVRVPVLSKHGASTRPSASMVLGLRTSAPRSASSWAAASWATVASRGSPSGTAATMRLTPVLIEVAVEIRPRAMPEAQDNGRPAGHGGRHGQLHQRVKAGLDAARGRDGGSGEATADLGLATRTATTTARAVPPVTTTEGPRRPSRVRSASSASTATEAAPASSPGTTHRSGPDSSISHPFGFEQTAVGWNYVARLQLKQIAGHQLLSLERQRVPRRAGRRPERSTPRPGVRWTTPARTRWTPPMTALTPMTPATRPASVIDPTAAANPAPTASTGVSGLASSAATAWDSRSAGGSGGGRTIRRAAA